MFSILAWTAISLATAPALSTVAEQSGWRRTGRYEEVARLCRAFEKAYPGKARCVTFGATPERRPMLAIVASSDGTLDPAQARRRNRPVLLAQGGIHAGEIDGKDAGFWLLRDMLDNKALPGVLAKSTFVFVPVFNIDGHERFGPNHRPNQRGPEEMGWRANSQNLNINRDYAKADTPELAAMLRLLAAWDPILYADLHVTDGARFEHDVAVLWSPQAGESDGPAQLRALVAAAEGALLKHLESRGHLPLSFYPSFVKDDDPASGFAVSVAPPRFSTGYWPLRNRIAVLVETHSWREYPWRVAATRDVLSGLLELTAKHGAAWRKAADLADAADRASPPGDVTLRWGNTGHARTLDFRGYKYRVEQSPVFAAPVIRYDERAPEIWKIPLLDELKPELTVRLPAAGYVVLPGHAGAIIERLKHHDIAFTVLDKPISGVSVEAFRCASHKLREGTYEGRTMVTAVEGEWAPERRDLPAGSLFVPLRQRGRRLVAHLLEPRAPDSFLAWGFFNAMFEQREYIENYVLEPAAQEMLARDPALRQEFERRLAGDAKLARDPGARAKFFERRHPTFDERLGLYPVLRVAEPPPR